MVKPLNLEPIKQRLFDLRVRGLGEWYPVYAAKRELTKEQICDDGDDMVKEIQRFRLENDRLRVEVEKLREENEELRNE